MSNAATLKSKIEAYLLTNAGIDEGTRNFYRASPSALAYHVAYMLGTVQHETAGTYDPIQEFGGPDYFVKLYSPKGNAKLAKQLGNRNDQDAIDYCGMGFVQITGRANYVRFGKRLGIALAENPRMATIDYVAMAIMCEGMVYGLFTGLSFAKMDGDGGKAPYTQYRRIINGVDKADRIATYSVEHLRNFYNSVYQTLVTKGLDAV